MSIQRTTAEIAAELTLYRAARTALVTGERVEYVNRDGRGMRLGSLTLKELNSAILEMEREYDAAEAVETGGPRRAAIGFYY